MSTPSSTPLERSEIEEATGVDVERKSNSNTPPTTAANSDATISIQPPPPSSSSHPRMTRAESWSTNEEYATEAELRSAFETAAPTTDASSSIIHSQQKSKSHTTSGSSLPPSDPRIRRISLDADDSNFDLTEDLFHPQQLVRKHKRKLQRELRECSGSCVLRAVKQFMPITMWLPNYRPRSDLLPDLLAGLMLAVVCIPQAMAYAALAGLDPIIGLYSCLAPAIMYAIFGCSPSMHIGPFALVSLLVATGVSQVVPANAPAEYIRDTTFVFAIMVGLVLILMSILRLGFAVSFLADCVLSAYTCAAAFLILTSQWKSFLGISVPTGLSFVETYIHIFSHLSDINVTAFLLGTFTVILLIALDELNTRFKWKIPIPSQLVAVMLGTLICYIGKLNTAYNLKVIGYIPQGLPHIGLPGYGGYDISVVGVVGNSTFQSPPTQHLSLLTFANFKLFLQPVFVIAVIAYIISISIAKNFATKENEKRMKAKEQLERNASAPPTNGAVSTPLPKDLSSIEIDANQELLALGIANLIGGFCSAYPAAGSLSRSALVYNAGVKSSLHNIFAAIILMFVLLFLTPLLYYLPSTVLAAIVFTALKSLLWQIEEGIRLYSIRKQDFLMWIGTFLSTLIFDTQVGIAIGLVISLLMLLKQTSRPPVAVLGRLNHTDLYRNIKIFPLAHTFRHVLIFRFDAPLHFANKDYFKAELMKEIKRAEEREWRLAQGPALLHDHDHLSPISHERLNNKLSNRFKRGLGEVSTATKHLMNKFERHIRAATRRAGLRRDELIHDRQNMHEVEDVELGDADAADAHDQIVLATQNGGINEEDDSSPSSPSHSNQPTRQPAQSDGTSSLDASPPTTTDSNPAPSPLDSSIDPLLVVEEIPSSPVPTLTRHDCRIEWVVLECSSMVDIDDAALKLLLTLPSTLQVTLVFAALKAPVRELLSRIHFFETRTPDSIHPINQQTKRSSIERPFVTVHQAVKYVLRQQMEAEQTQPVQTHETTTTNTIAHPPISIPSATTTTIGLPTTPTSQIV